MTPGSIEIRLMEADDFEAVVQIDREVTGSPRRDYYQMKFDKLFESGEFVPTSLVAVDERGAVVGFVMGQLYMGEFGIFEEDASLDTIGVDPDVQQRGIGQRLVDEFMDHLKELGVRRVNTLVDQGNDQLLRFFRANQFGPSSTINLERRL